MQSRSVLLGLVSLVPFLAGCLSGPAAILNPPPEGDAEPMRADTVTNYLSGLSEPIDGVTVLNSVLLHERIALPDGIHLDSWLVRPDIDARVPIVLEVTPYYPGGSPIAPLGDGHSLGNLGDVLVPLGYAVGIVSVRGTGNSEGCFTQGGPGEAKDTAAVIEHYAKQPWSNGRVGLIGVSYPGTTPQDVWVEAPPSLKTIVPIAGISDMYKYNFVNGVPIDIQGLGFNAYYWAFVGFPGYTGVDGIRDPANVPGSLAGEACQDQVAVQEGGASSTLDGNKDAYWQVRDFHAELRASWDKPRASVFYTHGLQDWNVKPHMMEDWLAAVQETGVPVKVWLGQWTHNWPQREDWWDHVMVAWFDQFLKEVDTGILDSPRVQVMDDDGFWRHEREWPPMDVTALTLYPADDQKLSLAAGSGSASYYDYQGMSPIPQAMVKGADHLVFVSEPLAEDLHISGLPRFEADVTASGRRASLILSLAERNATAERSFNFAAQSLNHVASLEAGDADIAGQKQRVGVDFFPQDDVAHKGSRLVLYLAANVVGGPGPGLIPISDGSTITVDLSTASLTLPLDTTLLREDPQPEPPGND